MAATEFGLLTGAVGLLKLALVAGQYAAKGFNASMRALGVGAGWAAGTVVAAVSTALAAIRQLNVAKITPIMQAGGQAATGANSIASQVSALQGSKDLGMFSAGALSSLSTEAARSGQGVNAQFMELTKTLGNFAIVANDPNKALVDLVSQFMLAKKEGKVTSDIFKEIAEASPDLKKGFEEVYGGAKGLDKALASGKVSFDEVLTAFNEGRVNSLLPFADALDNVNNTLVGKFKGALRGIKEQLTQLGMPLLESLVGPLDALERKMQVFLMRVAPTIQSVFAELLPADGGSLMGRFFDSMAMAINEHLPKLIGFVDRVTSRWREFSSGWMDFFTRAESYLKDMSSSWDSIWNNVLKPIGSEFVDTVEHAIRAFNGLVGDNQGGMELFAQTIRSIGEAIRNLIDGLTQLKQIMAPLIASFMKMIQMLSTVLEIPGMGLLGATAGMGMLMNRSGRRKANPNGRNAPRGGGLRGMMSGALGMAAFPFMGLPGQAMGQGGPAQSRSVAMRRAGRDFFQAGVKPFMKGVGPLLPAMAMTYVGGLISGGGSPTDTGRQGLGSALSGAGTGAAIGGMVGGVPGALIGGVLGGAVGYFSGTKAAEEERQRRKEESASLARNMAFEGLDPNSRLSLNRKRQDFGGTLAGVRTLQQARKITEIQLSTISEELNRMMTEGDISPDASKNIYTDYSGAAGNPGGIKDILTNKLFSGSGQAFYNDPNIPENIKKMADAYGRMENQRIRLEGEFSFIDYKDAFVTEGNAAFKELTEGAQMQSRNFELLNGLMGMNADETENLANKMDVNLMQNLLTLSEIMAGTGYEVDELGLVVDNMANRAQAAGKMLDIALGPMEQRRQEFESSAAYKAAGEAAFNYTGSDSAELEKLMGEFVSQEIQKALTDFQTGKYGSFDAMMKGLSGAAFTQILAGQEYVNQSGMGLENLDMYRALITEATDALRASAGTLSGRLQMDPGFANRFQTQLMQTTGSLDPTKPVGEQAAEAVSKLETYLKAEGVSFDTATLEGLVLGELQTGAKAMGSEIKAAVKSAILESVLRVSIITPRGVDDPTGDTTSDRWRRTLSKHSSLDSTVSGSRTITSGVRNNNLGSMMSDHRFGRAYDLTGDNLGQYAMAVKGAGGVAEFHGSAGSRHLHVVPPQGDASSPANVSGMGGNTNNYVIHVSSASSDAEAVADAVMARIRRAERTSRERQ